MKTYPDDFFKFIQENRYADPIALRLKFHGKNDAAFDYAEAIDQIEARRKAGSKLRALTSEPRFLFPATVCAEQASSSAVAAFHASLINEGTSVLDITSGLGSDTFAMAKRARSVIAIERDTHYHTIFETNITSLGFKNIKAVCDDCERWLTENDCRFDVVFADPHRRSDSNARTYAFSDCSPDISALATSILNRCSKLLIKASPMLDIRAASQQIPCCEEIYVVSENGECKELLISARKGAGFTNVYAVSIIKEKVELYTIPACETGRSDKTSIITDLRDIETGFLYEPNPSMMKVRAWNALSEKFNNIMMLGTNTNLFHSKALYTGFPGKVFRIKAILNSKQSKRLESSNFNVCTRNYPLSADKLAAKLKAKPSDTEFIFGVGIGSNKRSPVLIQCTKASDH